MITFTMSGSTARTEKFLDKMAKGDLYSNLEGLAQQGVQALSAATPKATGETASSWAFEIEQGSSGFTIWWTNSHIDNGFNVAVGLQYGHGTGTGGWVGGYDYINPALQAIFDKIADSVWKEVQNA